MHIVPSCVIRILTKSRKLIILLEMKLCTEQSLNKHRPTITNNHNIVGCKEIKHTHTHTVVHAYNIQVLLDLLK